MEVTKSAAVTSVAPNIDLSIGSKEDKEQYYLAVEIKRTPFEGTLRPMNVLQGMFWDALIFNFVLKTSKSMRTAWKAQTKEDKEDLHKRFAIKYGTEEEMKAYRTKMQELIESEAVSGKIFNTVRMAYRRLPKFKRKDVNETIESDMGVYDKFVFLMAHFNILLVLPVEKDDDEEDFVEEENEEA